jgi:hypothetical protein
LGNGVDFRWAAAVREQERDDLPYVMPDVTGLSRPIR